MSTRAVSNVWRIVLPALGWLALACTPTRQGGEIDSQTNWMKACQIDAQCGSGSLSCICGVCTSACGGDDACASLSLEGGACVAAEEPGVIARCGGNKPADPGLCLPRCEDVPCPVGQMCVASVCQPIREPKVHVSVDTDPMLRRQPLIGFGASIAYAEAEITSHPKRDEFYTTAFKNLGLDVLRLRNRYGDTGDDDLTTARTLIDAVTASIGRAPTLLLSTWSPPAALKANGKNECQGNPGTCTLIKTPAGVYDYAGFARYWRESLDAYSAVGVVPDYIGIQNNANWVPTAQEIGEACRFLPVEGTTTVTINGVDVEIAYPGYAEALDATLEALDGFAPMPKVLAPETSNFAAVNDYTPDLDFASVDALAHHLYGVDLATVDKEGLAALGDFSSAYARPILQTEMQAPGYETAVLIHHTLEIEGGSAYIVTSLTGAAVGSVGANTEAPIALGPNDFVIQESYYALQHYALHTDPGWVRVKSESTRPDELLVSSWISPAEDKLTLVLVNTGTEELDVGLDLERTYATSEVSRSAFNGTERNVSLGALSAERIVNLPSHAVVTVALSD